MGSNKSNQNRLSAGSNIASHSRTDVACENDTEIRQEAKARLNAQLPTKAEMAVMFVKLENSLKTDMATLNGDLSQILGRVEDTEKRLDTHTLVMELKEEMKNLQIKGIWHTNLRIKKNDIE